VAGRKGHLRQCTCRWRPGGSGGAESWWRRGRGPRPRRTGPPNPPGTGPIPAPRSRSRSWWGGRREAVRGGGGRVRSAVWFGPGRFGSGTGVTVAGGTVAAAGVTGLRPGFWARRWSEDFRLGSRREEGRGGIHDVCFEARRLPPTRQLAAPATRRPIGPRRPGPGPGEFPGRDSRSRKSRVATAKALVVPAPGRSVGLRRTGPAAAPGRGERRGWESGGGNRVAAGGLGGGAGAGDRREGPAGPNIGREAITQKIIPATS
jgi:hypothetical protein